MKKLPVDRQELRDRTKYVPSSGQRSGSPLLQLLINSAPEIPTWGEQDGSLNGSVQSFRTLVEWESYYARNR